MANFQDEIERINSLIQDLTDGATLESHVIAMQDATALVKNRILNENKDAKGAPFGQYSTRKVPLFFSLGRSLSKGAESRLKAQAKKEAKVRKDKQRLASYADLRRANNLPSKTKNYSFSGQMIRDIGILSQEQTEGEFTVVIGGQSERSKELLRYQFERDKVNLLELSQDEIDLVTDAANERILGILQNYFQ